MPRVKTYEGPYAGMKRLLLGYGVTASKLSRILDCSFPKAKSRIDNPGKLTVEELDMIRRYGHVPIEEIREKMLT